NHPMQRKLLTTIIGLLKQETLLEHTLLFSEQLLHADSVPSRKRQVLMTFLLALNQSYKEHRTVQYYAAQQNLSARHFADIIKQESHYTPMDWINMVTINQAKNLLRQPNMLVKQVADELGFPEQFTFRKYFKTHTGVSPTEYQSENK
ncbi:MAG: helix-turn-helix transcriptional regulator, partial [Paludibacteraceae bacterium]|nr:helix-turn-helix transcriptional regulator [Paludibacteraceae bacterium]